MAGTVAPRWYAERLGDPAVAAFPDPPAPGPARSLRAALRVLKTAGGAERVAVVYGAPGSGLVLLWEALRGRRRTVVLELLRPQPGTGLRASLRETWDRVVCGWALRRSASRCQLMSGGELRRYELRYGLPPDRLRLVPWARSRGIEAQRPAADDQPIDVFASGRAGTDWATLAAALGEPRWRVALVCSEAELTLVRELAAGAAARVEVHCELPRGEHDRLLARSRLCVVPLLDRDPSAGHLRLMAAFDAGVPVIASRVEGLAEMLAPGTAALVPASEPGALRSAIERLLASPELREELASAAASAARRRTYRDYFEDVRELISSV